MKHGWERVFNTEVIIAQIWFGTADYEMSYKATKSEVDAEVNFIIIGNSIFCFTFSQ